MAGGETGSGRATMLAAVLTAPGRITLTEAPVPEPASGQVRVRLEGSGICASNLAAWGGLPWFSYPFEPGELGHEAWGRVDALGSEVRDLAIGDRVALLSTHAYAEYDLADATAVLRLPRSLDGQPFPGEPLGCALNIFRRSEIRPGQTIAIVGIGFLGALLTRLAANVGARVIALSRRTYALDLARSMGATDVVPLDDHDRIIRRIRDLTDGQLCERVIEAVGKQWPLDLAAELTQERGRLIVAGYHQDGPRQVNMQLWNWRGLDVINAHERDPRVYLAGMRAAVDAVASGALDPAPLYTHCLRLHELGRALDLTQDRPTGFVKALWIAEASAAC